MAEPKLIHGFLEKAAAAHPDKTAVVHGEQRWSYGRLERAARNLAARLRENGIGPGDRVVLLMENSGEYAAAYYGILKSGAVVASLDPGLKPAGLQYRLDNLEPAAMVAAGKSERLLRAVRLGGPAMKLLILASPRKEWRQAPFVTATLEESITGPGEPAATEVGPDDLASIVYTSGSSGHPKGVMLTHANIVANTRAICGYLALTADDIQMVVLPFFYVMGKSLLNTHVAVGGTVVINNRFLYPADVVREMAAEAVTGFSGVPSTYAYLLHRSPLARYRDKLPALRYCTQAGGHMSGQLKNDLRAALPPHTDIFIMYGASEASARLTWLPPDRFARKMDSIGRAIDGVEVRVVDEAGRPVAAGVVGELVARGPNIMRGYWRAPEATRAAIDAEGFYHTGDLAWMDEEGDFYLSGRKDRLLKVSGHKVNPQEVEECLMQSRMLLETAVIGVPDALGGYRLVALCVGLDKTSDEAELRRHCRRMLPAHHVPGEFTFVKALPKRGSGKVDSRQCEAAYHQLAGRQ